MCGINGIALSSRNGRSVDEATLVRMRDVLHHRGPDESGLFIEGPIGLAHRRLSIVDVKSGHQPMGNEDDSIKIVYNGEVYNHADHRATLEAQGHVFATRSDTETIIHLYEQHGAKCVDFLRGMFGFAIWNRRSKELLIARDRLGVKPVYYVHTADGSLYFASEIKALLAAGAIKPQLNRRVLPDYLANRATSDDQTLFEDVKRLPPGHTLTWRDGRIEIKRFWDVTPGKPMEGATPASTARTPQEYVDEWRELFRQSVKLRLMADVPLGMFLSGGIDSSAIAAMMSKMVSDPIKTFTVAFDVPEANELGHARTVANAFGTDHHDVLIAPQTFADSLPHLIWHEDEPLAHSASVPLFYVSQLAQRHVKVVLTGEGSDELLGGYYRYRTTLMQMNAGRNYHRFTNEPLREVIRGLADLVSPQRMRNKYRRTFLWREPDIDALYFDNFAVFPQDMQRGLFTGAMQSQLQDVYPYTGMRQYFDAYPDATLLQRMLYADLKTYLHELLMKQDQMSMAASIESRVPFLDHKLVEFSTALPDHMKVDGWTTKRVLREAMEGLLPDSILKRPKMGFPVPLERWFRGEFKPLLESTILSERSIARGIFQPEYVRRLVAEHAAGSANHTERLWMLLNFELWQRHIVEGEPRIGKLAELAETPRK